MNPKDEFSILEALRGTAALCVYFSHSDAAHLATNSWLIKNKETLGVFGVYLFFGVSGYLIWQSAKRYIPQKGGLSIYALHRITRIIPLFIVNLFFVIFLLKAIGSIWVPNVDTVTVVRHLTFTQSLLPSVSRNLNPVLWTLTHEMLFYVLAPVIFIVTRRFSIFVVLGSLLVLSMYSMTNSFGFFGPFLNVLYAFVIGILLVEINDSKRPAVGLVLILAAALFSVLTNNAILSIALTSLSVLAFCLTSEITSFTSIRSVKFVLKPLIFCGTISYSLYIWHYLIIGIAEYYGTSLSKNIPYWNNSALGRGVLFTAFVVFVSWISYVCIERPAMGAGRRRLQTLLFRPA
jgi:exopolysaccharide production protein ExoZ